MTKAEHEVITCDRCGEVFIVPNGDNKYYNCFEVSKAVSPQQRENLTDEDYSYPEMVTLLNLEGMREIYKCNASSMLGPDTQKEGHRIMQKPYHYCSECAADIVPEYLELVEQLNEFFDSI